MNEHKVALLAEWEELFKTWQFCKAAMGEAENVIDAEVMNFLIGDGVLPDKALVDQLDDLRHDEYQARGEIDLFISEMH